MQRVAAITSLILLAAATLTGCGDKSDARAAVATGGDAGRGHQLLVQYGCASCHTIQGVRGERGLVGPPLTGIRQRAIIGGSLPNTPSNLEQWIMHPRQFNPNSAMPELGVTPEQARDITAYLYSQ
ncbi:MAG: c-type cytochrome [Telluria sp.]